MTSTSSTKTTIEFNDKVVRQFMWASIIWGIVGMLVGVIVATQLNFHQLNLTSWLSFGRLRPLHTNAVIFAFVGNMMFAGVYYSTQRLCKARMASDLLSKIALLGLAGHHRQCGDHAAAGFFPGSGIRRVDLAHQHHGGADLGGVCGELLLDAAQAQ
jgi:cbb3-type cytochrome oxidase subunit 1